MEELINTINSLQEVFSADGSQGMELPQIVVLGNQSSGKSSILEHLVGKSFLPRGTGIVTRCPLILQLVYSHTGEEYAIFKHNKNKVFTDYTLITREIEEETNRLAGRNNSICDTPIFLKMFSASFLTLTMVDLPGLTKVPVGDQPLDIEQQTRELTLRYVENPNCIILVVTPANADMATSESLKIAREVDPDGKRTIAVITKLDIMDQGTDAKNMLSGKIIPVKLGIIGVVNRSQKDTIEGKNFSQSLKDEAIFFYTKYRNIAAFHGSPYLKKTVQAILINHIRNRLPKLKEKLNQKLISQRVELQMLGEQWLGGPTLLLDLIKTFSFIYCSAIKGNSANIQTDELYGGARINYIFQESLAVALNSIDALTGLTKGVISTVMQNASGATPTLFVPETAFELLVKRQIKRLRNPCLQCVYLIQEELKRIVQNCIDDKDLGLQRYPKLQQEMYEVMNELLQSRIPITTEMVDHLLDVQLAYINTAHPDFLPSLKQGLTLKLVIGDRSDLPVTRPSSFNMLQRSEEGNLPAIPQGQKHHFDKESRDCILIQELIKSYFSITKKTVQDTVPKVIMHFLVNFLEDHIMSELVSKLYKANFSDLLQESYVIDSKRNEVKAAISALEQANDILNTLKIAPSVGNKTNLDLQLS